MDDRILWLLKGDVSVQYLTHLYLLRSDTAALQALQRRIETEGYAAKLLRCRNTNGHWGSHYYQPKWTSTHYTLLELKSLSISPAAQACREMAGRTLEDCMLPNGGMNLSKYEHSGDMGVSGMVLNYAAYFAKENPCLLRLVDYILAHQKADGGFHWSEDETRGEPHTTICVAEGLTEYVASGLPHKRAETKRAIEKAADYLLRNQLFISHSDRRFLKLSWPYRYRYDLLRALECLALLKTPYGSRMTPALQWLKNKQNADGRWRLENVHKGNVHFEWEKRGEPSRMITLKAMMILERFEHQ